MCNTGYELTGSDSRTCQSDGSWNGTETMCTRGVLQCCGTNFGVELKLVIWQMVTKLPN